MTIYRYKFAGGITKKEIDQQIPQTYAATILQTTPVSVDVQVLPDPVPAATKEDLDGYMANIGWMFCETDPSDLQLASLMQWDAADAILTNANAPTPVVRNEREMLAYANSGLTTISYFTGIVPRTYIPQENLRMMVFWVAATATAGDVRWSAAFENLVANGPNVDSDNFGTDKGVNSPTSAVNGEINSTVINFDNAEADLIQPGNPFRLRLRRQSGSAGDTMIGDAQLMRVELVQ